MNLIDMLLNDPVIIFSFVGLALVLGICSYYVYYFLSHIADNK